MLMNIKNYTCLYKHKNININEIANKYRLIHLRVTGLIIHRRFSHSLSQQFRRYPYRKIFVYIRLALIKHQIFYIIIYYKHYQISKSYKRLLPFHSPVLSLRMYLQKCLQGWIRTTLVIYKKAGNQRLSFSHRAFPRIVLNYIGW